MTVVALAAAQLLTDDVDAWGMPVLRALLPLAGMTLIEQQAERARAAGVSTFLVLVDGVPPALAEACDRIRARGLALELVRSGADVLRLAKGNDRLLLVADGLIAGEQIWSVAGGAKVASLLVTTDASVTQGLERIDAQSRWAGLATLPMGALAVLETAPRDWDPQLLLFRAAIQDSATRIAVDPSLFVSGDMMLAETSAAVAALERRFLAAPRQDHGGLGRRYLAGPLVRVFAARLLGSQRSGTIARILAALAFASAAAAFLMGQPALAIGLGIVGVLADETADFVAQFRTESRIWQRVGDAALILQLLAILIGERGAIWGSNAEWLGQGSFPLTLLVALSALTSKVRIPADDALCWPILGLTAIATGVHGSFEWVAMLALALLLISLIDLPFGTFKGWKRGATEKA